MATLLQAIALSSCIIFAYSTPSENNLCVESIDFNSEIIVYSNTAQDTFSQNIAPFVDDISTETMIIVLNFTVSSSDKGNESRIYQVSKTLLCYYVSPELIDLMTFTALDVVERTRQISINIHSFTTCGNQSWEKLLLNAFAVDEETGFVRLLQQNASSNQTYYSAVVSSGLLVFMPLGLTSLFALYIVLIPTVDATVSRKCSRLTDKHQSHRCRRALNQFFASMYVLNVGICPLYLAYIIVNTVCYYLYLDCTSEVFANQYTIPPFTSNIVFLCLTVCVSFLGGLCAKESCHTRCSCSLRISFACNIALASAGLYHSLFLLLVLVEDFNTAFSSILVQVTVLVSIYTLFPAALQHYRIAKLTRRFCSLWFLLSLLTVVPFLYLVTLIGAKDLFNAGHTYITTKFFFAVVLFMTFLTWIFSFFMFCSVFKRTYRPSSHKRSRQDVPTEGAGVDAEIGPQDDTARSLVASSRRPAYSSKSSFSCFVPPVVMVYLKGTSRKKCGEYAYV